MTKYFDDSEFNISPAKTELNTDYYNLDLNKSYVQNVFYRKNYVFTNDNWFSSLWSERKYEFYEKTTGSIFVGSIIPGKYDMLTIFINKHE